MGVPRSMPRSPSKVSVRGASPATGGAAGGAPHGMYAVHGSMAGGGQFMADEWSDGMNIIDMEEGAPTEVDTGDISYLYTSGGWDTDAEIAAGEPCTYLLVVPLRAHRCTYRRGDPVPS